MNLPQLLRRRRPAPPVTPHEHHHTWRRAALWLDYPGMRIHGRDAETDTGSVESGATT
ncbi:hypothetical protein [Nocardia stercoris]|uniref:hypothetical protein n=1 Tax=Nocardia stercoris TaxID=2483361 RepID=UPI001319D576|nr:hypothetical protein [Nocardia stercoris]